MYSNATTKAQGRSGNYRKGCCHLIPYRLTPMAELCLFSPVITENLVCTRPALPEWLMEATLR